MEDQISVTCKGHVTGMLDRDQRTAKLADFTKCGVVDDYKTLQCYVSSSRSNASNRSKTVVISHNNIPRRTSQLPQSSCKPRKSRLFWKSFLLKLKHALIVGVYLSLFTIVPSALTAPTNSKTMSERTTEQPKWINPCDTADNVGAHGDANSDVQFSHFLTTIIRQANTGLNKANEFRDDFVEKTYKATFDKVHENWKHDSFSYLPTSSEIPKKLGQPIPEEHLKSLELDQTLLNTYKYLQQIAVGLEQVVWDQKDHNGEFEHRFAEVEQHLRSVLCEIHYAIYERNLKIESDVGRDSMPDALRTSVKTEIQIRDWIIYRDYMNTLEYIIQTFTYFKEQLN